MGSLIALFKLFEKSSKAVCSALQLLGIGSRKRRSKHIEVIHKTVFMATPF